VANRPHMGGSRTPEQAGHRSHGVVTIAYGLVRCSDVEDPASEGHR
jgi:hypothetical protein